MTTRVPFEEYPFGLFRTKHQLSVQRLDFINDHNKKHIHIIDAAPLSFAQKVFFTELLELPGVLRITVNVNDIIIYKWPGYEWQNIDPAIEEHINTYGSAVTDRDLKEQVQQIIKSETS